MKILAAALIALSASAAIAQDNPLQEGETWAELRGDLIGDTVVNDGSALFTVEAPYRANDAATVPIRITQGEDMAAIQRAMLVIDENPAPMAADIRFGEAMAPVDFELRVRVNMYSNVRVIAETPEGSFMNGRFVKASGGCSAPASRDPEVALKGMGEMRLKQFGDAPMVSGARREAQIMIRHPNYSGLQRDQITQLFINAHFIDMLEVWQGDEMLFTIEGGISISENPVFRFTYRDNGAATFRIRAHDTEGNSFENILPKTSGS